jgi:hypothetical protein
MNRIQLVCFGILEMASNLEMSLRCNKVLHRRSFENAIRLSRNICIYKIEEIATFRAIR